MIPLNMIYGWMVVVASLLSSLTLVFKTHLPWYGIFVVFFAAFVVGLIFGELTSRLGRMTLKIGDKKNLIPLSMILYVVSCVPGLVIVILCSPFTVEIASSLLE